MRPVISNSKVGDYRQTLRSDKNAPNVGEFNNIKVSPYLEPDPNLERRFKNGLIVVMTDTRIKRGNHRQYHHLETKFDARNDPAWHVKNTQKYSVGAIVSTGDEQVEVASVDELNLIDVDGHKVGQESLDEHMEFLNGTRLIGTFSAQSTMHRVNQNQRTVTRYGRKLKNYGCNSLDHEAEVRDRRRILDSFDTQTASVSSLNCQ